MNTQIVLPLKTMTVAEKFEILQTIWDDLICNSEQVPAPEWHGRYLREMKESVAAGKEEFVDFETAEKILREQTP